MTINISEILANPSVVREYTVEPSFEMLELRQGAYPVSRKESFVLTVSRKDKKVHVTGDTVVCLLIPCDRCLDDVEVSFPIHIDSLWSPDETAEGIGDVDEITFMDGCILDVDKLVSDEIVVALPTKVLCKEDCKGLCSVCGINRNHQSCDCDVTPVDPRMAAIQDIFKSFQEK